MWKEGLFLQNNVNTETLCSFTRHFSLIFSYNSFWDVGVCGVWGVCYVVGWWEHNIHKRTQTKTKRIVKVKHEHDMRIRFFFFFFYFSTTTFPACTEPVWFDEVLGGVFCGWSVSCVFFRIWFGGWKIYIDIYILFGMN